MAKRKSTMDLEKPTDPNATDSGDEGSSSDDFDEKELLDVDFEFFDPQPQDFHGIRTLLSQLFDVDSPLFELSALTDLIIAQPLLGSTVKVDGMEGDPFAFLTILNLRQHKDELFIRKLVDYTIAKSTSNAAVHDILKDTLANEGQHTVGLLLTERLLNMPVEVTPPMYNMLLEEITWALEEGEPYAFTHFLIPTKIYSEVLSKLDDDDSRPLKRSKSQKKEKKKKGSEVFYFHPEDETLEKTAGGMVVRYDFTNKGSPEASDSKRAFYDVGIESKGELILIKREDLEKVVKEMLTVHAGTPS